MQDLEEEERRGDAEKSKNGLTTHLCCPNYGALCCVMGATYRENFHKIIAKRTLNF